MGVRQNQQKGQRQPPVEKTLETRQHILKPPSRREHQEKKRNRLEVIRDILIVIRDKNGKAKPTHILYKSNLSHIMMKDYIKDLLSKEFIKESHTKEGRRYSITEKGIKYLQEYKTVINFVESFGLSPNSENEFS